MRHAHKLLALAAMMAVALPLASSPAAAADIGISLNIGQPDYYGPLDVQDYSRPRVYYREPYWVDRRRGRNLEPIYLRAPRAHRSDWSRHCRQYDACGRRVYFVEDRWYNDVYAPKYRERHGNDQRGDRHHDNRGHDGHDGRDDHDRSDGYGPGHPGHPDQHGRPNQPNHPVHPTHPTHPTHPGHPAHPGQAEPHERRGQDSGGEYHGRPLGTDPNGRDDHDYNRR